MLNPQPSAGNPTSWFLTNSGEAHLALTSKSVIMMTMMILHTSRCAVEVRQQWFHSWLRVQWTTDPPGAACSLSYGSQGGVFPSRPSEKFPPAGGLLQAHDFFGFCGQSRGVQNDPTFALNLHVFFRTPKLPTSTSYQMQTSYSNS